MFSVLICTSLVVHSSAHPFTSARARADIHSLRDELDAARRDVESMQAKHEAAVAAAREADESHALAMASASAAAQQALRYRAGRMRGRKSVAPNCDSCCFENPHAVISTTQNFWSGFLRHVEPCIKTNAANETYVATRLLCLSFAHRIFSSSIRSHHCHLRRSLSLFPHSECESRLSALSNRCDEAEAAALRSETARVDASAAAALELETGMVKVRWSPQMAVSLIGPTVNMSNHSLIPHLHTRKKAIFGSTAGSRLCCIPDTNFRIFLSSTTLICIFRSIYCLLPKRAVKAALVGAERRAAAVASDNARAHAEWAGTPSKRGLGMGDLAYH